MSKVEGGILGTVKGRIADIVFSEARGRDKKVNTVREFVKPANPQTTAQQTQRSKFSLVLAAARTLGQGFWSDLFNRAVGDLPGFQSFVSNHLSNMVSSSEFDIPPPLSIGDLDAPDTFSASSGTNAGEVDLTWDATVEGNGDGNDNVRAYSIEKTETDPELLIAEDHGSVGIRSDGAAVITSNVPSTESILVGLWMEGASGGPAPGEPSPIKYASATVA